MPPEKWKAQAGKQRRPADFAQKITAREFSDARRGQQTSISAQSEKARNKLEDERKRHSTKNAGNPWKD